VSYGKKISVDPKTYKVAHNNGEMNTGRWGSALLSFIVPYVVNIQGRVTGNQHKN
jgi:hypothetical protein